MASLQVLIAVIGKTPQIITETLYALHKEGKPMPQRIIVLTTAVGKEQTQLSLLEEKILLKFCRDYDLPPIYLFDEDIKVPTGKNGEPLNDARSVDDHNVIADFITNEVKAIADDPNTTIHASIAGGRKTMTFFLGYAMSLFGRRQDTLSHVLVSEDYENLPNFFYPTPDTTDIYDKRSSRKLDASKAEVTLANIPFVRMRQDMPSKMAENLNLLSYSEIIHQLNQANEKLEVIVKLNTAPDENNIHIPQLNVSLKLHPHPLAQYCWIRERQIKGEPVLKPTNNRTYSRNGVEFLKWLQKVAPEQEVARQQRGLKIKDKYLLSHDFLKDIDFSLVNENADVSFENNKFSSTLATIKKCFEEKMASTIAKKILPHKTKIYIDNKLASPYLFDLSSCDIKIPEIDN